MIKSTCTTSVVLAEEEEEEEEAKEDQREGKEGSRPQLNNAAKKLNFVASERRHRRILDNLCGC